MNDKNLTIEEILELQNERKKINVNKKQMPKKSLKELGAGTEYALTTIKTSEDRPPITAILYHSPAIFPRFNLEDNNCIKRNINGKTYTTSSNNHVSNDIELFLFFTLFGKINNNSIDNRSDINSVTFTFEELDSLNFISSKKYRKRFNTEERILTKNIRDRYFNISDKDMDIFKLEEEIKK